MCDPCQAYCQPQICSSECEPCYSPCPNPCEPCCPMPCGPCPLPCGPSPCDPCPSPCEPYCPSPCSPYPSPCSPCPTPCDPCDPCCRPKRCKSRQLRGGVLITQCDCVKRNGLQMDCPRTECQGKPQCDTRPWPMCCPSKYMWRYINRKLPSRTPRLCKPFADGQCNPCVKKVFPDPCCYDCN